MATYPPTLGHVRIGQEKIMVRVVNGSESIRATLRRQGEPGERLAKLEHYFKVNRKALKQLRDGKQVLCDAAYDDEESPTTS